MMSKKKNLLFMWGWDRKIRPSGSPIVFTHQAKQRILGQIFYPTLTLMIDSHLYTVASITQNENQISHCLQSLANQMVYQAFL